MCGGYCRSTLGDQGLRDNCTKESRLLLFNEWLESQGFWPLSRLRETSCRSFVGDRGTVACNTNVRTPCGFDKSCPLGQSKERLCTLLEVALRDSPGLKLEAYDNESLQEGHSEDPL